MSDEIITALNKLSSETGEMKGEFKGLKDYIEAKTDNCSRNYDSLSDNMDKLTRKINATVIEKEVEERVTGTFKRVLYNRVTLLCTIVGLAIAFAGLQNSNTKKSDKKLAKISRELKEIKSIKKLKKGINFENLETELR
jgi:hypothetical protein